MKQNKPNIVGGYLLWARQTIDSNIFVDKPDVWFKIWFYLVCRVNHKENGRFVRGSGFLKYDWIMSATGATKAQVQHCIAWLKRRHMIVTKKATRGMVVTVVNYDTYQKPDNYRSHTEATQKPHRSHTKNNNEKNEKNDKYIYTSIDMELSQLLFGLIRQNKPDFPEPNLDAWAVEVRRLREIEGRTPEQIRVVIKWCQADDFWWDKVLSTASLRKKSKTDGVKRIERIEMQMQRKTNESDKISREFATSSKIGETIEA